MGPCLLPFVLLLSKRSGAPAIIGIALGGLAASCLFGILSFSLAIFASVAASILPEGINWIVLPLAGFLALDPDQLIRDSGSKLGRYWIFQLGAGVIGLIAFAVCSKAAELRTAITRG